jgi:hypothetical protein
MSRYAHDHAIGASGIVQGLTDAGFQLRGYRRPAELLALTTGSRKAGTDSFLDDRALELGKYAHHLKHRLAGRRRGVGCSPAGPPSTP